MEQLNQLIIHHNGLFFSLDGDVVYLEMPKGDPETGKILSRSFHLDSLERGEYDQTPELAVRRSEILEAYHDPENKRQRTNAVGILEKALSGSREIDYVLNRGTFLILNMDARVGIAGALEKSFIPKDSEAYLQSAKFGPTLAVNETTNNRMLFDIDDEDFFIEMLREEVSHHMDEEMAMIAGVHDSQTFTRDYSHLLVTDEMREADTSGYKYFIGDSKTDYIIDWRNLSKRLEQLIDKNPAVARLADTTEPSSVFSKVQMLSGELSKDLLSLYDLSNYPIVGRTTDENEGLFKLNSSRDSEVMVKFHRLRMRLEDRLVSGGEQPDHYSVDSPVLDVLHEVAPQLTAAYRDSWLPALNIVTGVEDPVVRQTVLRAHMPKDGEEAGRITDNEIAAINSALEAIDGKSPEVTLDDQPGGSRDSLVVQGTKLPVTVSKGL